MQRPLVLIEEVEKIGADKTPKISPTRIKPNFQSQNTQR